MAVQRTNWHFSSFLSLYSNSATFCHLRFPFSPDPIWLSVPPKNMITGLLPVFRRVCYERILKFGHYSVKLWET